MIVVLILGVAFFLLFYAVGSLFLQKCLNRKDSFSQHVINFWVGLLLTVSCYAIVKAELVTVLILLPFILLAFREAFSRLKQKEEAEISTYMFVVFSGIVYVLVFFLQVNFAMDALANPFAYLSYIHPFDGERYIYSTILSFLHYDGVETISAEAVLEGFSGVTLYHFLEFWLGSLFKTILNEKSDIVLFYFVYPLFKTFAILTICSVLSDKVGNGKTLLLTACIVFCFAVFGFLWISSPISKLHLRDMIMMPMLVLVLRSLYLKRHDTALAFLIVASVEYILFLPVLFLTVTLFYNQYSRVDYLKVVGFVVAYSVFFFLFKEDVGGKHFSFGAREALEAVFSWEKGREIYRAVLLAFLTYPIRLVLSFFVLTSLEHLKDRRLVIDIGYWMVFFFIGYHLLTALTSDMSLDAWQFKQVAVILSTVAFLFVLNELIKRKMLLVCLVVLLLLSDYKYPFSGAKKNDNYDFALEQKLGVVSKGKPIKGFFVDENKGLPEKWALFYYPTRATDYARSNDYRMYLFNYDISRFKKSISMFEPSAQPILNRIIKPLFPMNVDLQTNIRNYGVSIVWVNKKSKYLSVFKDKKPLHELESYYIFYLGDGTTKG